MHHQCLLPCTQLPRGLDEVPGWVLGTGPRGSCPDGSLFAPPINGLDNSMLRMLLQQQGVARVWLPITGPSFLPGDDLLAEIEAQQSRF